MKIRITLDARVPSKEIAALVAKEAAKAAKALANSKDGALDSASWRLRRNRKKKYV